MTITLTREEAQQLLEVFELFLEEAEDVTTLEDKLVKMLRARLAQPEPMPSPHNRLVQFACEVLADFPHSMPDGFDLQDLAIKHSLLIGREVTEPCGDECFCAEYHSPKWMAEGVTCYRRHPMLLKEKNT